MYIKKQTRGRRRNKVRLQMSSAEKNKASSGRRVTADHAAARLISSMSHALTELEYSMADWGSKT
jgi:hypothetical protein